MQSRSAVIIFSEDDKQIRKTPARFNQQGRWYCPFHYWTSIEIIYLPKKDYARKALRCSTFPRHQFFLREDQARSTYSRHLFMA
ncbi:MAG: hypothetical protein D3910_06570 [Candidatus Electrothrix sp. ATG2]|nr:hypothetical protein [Candidatus Electrothrix sp. ATG2]